MYLERHSDDNDPLITSILLGFIRSDAEGKGIPCLINRNPTIGYGGIIQCYVIGISAGYTMTMPLTVLKGLAADFDGDTYVIMGHIVVTLYGIFLNCWEAKPERAC